MEYSIQKMFTYLKLKDNVSEEVLNKLIDSGILVDEEIEAYRNGNSAIILSEFDINNLDLYNSIDCAWHEFDEQNYQNFVFNILSGEHFLVFAQDCMQNGTSGYGLFTSMADALYRNYDVEQVIQDMNEKYITIIESSHDVSTGHISYIVSLTGKEYNKVRKLLENEDFEKIDKFIDNIID